MAINGIGGGGFNPYANSVASSIANSVANTVATRSTPALRQPASESSSASATAPHSIAEAIKHDATVRAAQVNSPKAPDGVDQDLWSVLTKEERSFFVRAGAMGPLTYGRNAGAQAPSTTPIMRGGRLDIKA